MHVGTVTYPLRLRHNGTLFSALPASEGSSKNALCIDGTTGQIFQNASVTCTVSSARFKENIQPLSCTEASRIVTRLIPVRYDEKETKQRRIGIIAEQADSVDHRLASRNAKGIVTATNYEEVFSAMLRDRQCRTRSSRR